MKDEARKPEWCKSQNHANDPKKPWLLLQNGGDADRDTDHESAQRNDEPHNGPGHGPNVTARWNKEELNGEGEGKNVSSHADTDGAKG